jgi:hypothetical protein
LRQPATAAIRCWNLALGVLKLGTAVLREMTMPLADDERLSVRPTLFIALGGTAMEVLERLRHKLLTREWNGQLVGGLDELPQLSFFAFDMSPRYSFRSASKWKTEWRSDELFALSKLPWGMCGRAPDGTRPILTRHPTISPWLEDGAWLDGTGERDRPRQAARLAFFLRREQVEDHLRNKLATLCGRVNEAQPRGVRIDIKIVTSAAGNTGSGVLFDMGYLAQKLGREMLGERLGDVGLWLALRDLFPEQDGGVDRCGATSYAVLAELEYAMKASVPPLHQGWTPGETMPPRPFDWVHLFDATNTAGQHVRRPECFDVVADLLLRDVTEPELARAVHDTAEAGLRWPGEDVVQREPDQTTWTRRLSGLGCAVVETQAHRDLAERKLEAVMMMLDKAVLGDIAPPTSLYEFLEGIERLMATPDSIILHIIAPSKNAPPAPKTIDELLDQASLHGLIPSRLKDLIAAAKAGRNTIERARELVALLRGGLDFFAGGRDERHAEIKRMVREGTSLDSLHAALDDAFTIAGLAGVRHALVTARQRYADTSEHFRQSGEEHKRDADIARESLAAAAAKLGKILAGPRWLIALRLWSVRRLARQIWLAAVTNAKANIFAQTSFALADRYAGFAGEVGEELRGGFGEPQSSGLLGEVDKVEGVVRRTIDDIETRRKALHANNDGAPLFVIGERNTIPPIDQFARELREEAGAIVNADRAWRAPLFDRLDAERMADLVVRLHHAATDVLAKKGFTPETLPDMATTLNQLSQTDIDTLAENLTTAAMPWLHLVPSPLDGLVLDPGAFKPTAYYTLEGTAAAFEASLKHAIQRYAVPAGGGQRCGYNVAAAAPQDRTRLVLMTELAGLPIDTLALLRRWRCAYDQWQREPRLPLHIDKDADRFVLML